MPTILDVIRKYRKMGEKQSLDFVINENIDPYKSVKKNDW